MHHFKVYFNDKCKNNNNSFLKNLLCSLQQILPAPVIYIFCQWQSEKAVCVQQGLLLSTVKRAIWSYRHIYHCWLVSTKAMSFFPFFCFPFGFTKKPLRQPYSYLACKMPEGQRESLITGSNPFLPVLLF